MNVLAFISLHIQSSKKKIMHFILFVVNISNLYSILLYSRNIIYQKEIFDVQQTFFNFMNNQNIYLVRERSQIAYKYLYGASQGDQSKLTLAN